MQVNSISNFNQISYGKSSSPQKIRTAENKSYADSFRKMAQSPTFDFNSHDIDEFEFRSGIEDFQIKTEVKTRNCAFKDWLENSQKATNSGKEISINTKEQANAVEKLIEQLKTEREFNPSETKYINAQISRLRGILSRYYKAFAKTIK